MWKAISVMCMSGNTVNVISKCASLSCNNYVHRVFGGNKNIYAYKDEGKIRKSTSFKIL